MAKRKITVTVDDDLVEAVQRLGAESLSSVVNAALARDVERRRCRGGSNPSGSTVDRLLGT